MQEIGKESTSQSVAILTTVLETVAGVILFLIWSHYANIPLVRPEALPFLLWIEFGILILTFLLSGILLFSSLRGFIPSIWRIFISSFLSFIVLSLVIVSSLNYSWYRSSSVSLIPLFIALGIILYLTTYTKEEEVLRMRTHKRILNKLREKIGAKEDLVEKAFRSWDHIVRGRTLKKWSLAESLFLSLLITLAFWGNLIIINRIEFTDLFQGLALLCLLVFLIVLFLINVTKESKRESRY